jgi:hypothetical protein
MNTIEERITGQDWKLHKEQLNNHGFVLLKDVLAEEECLQVRSFYPDDNNFRKTINMARYRFGSGEYKYFRYPLPELVQLLRTALYPPLVPIANLWMQVYNQTITFPEKLDSFLQQCHQKEQLRPTPLLLTYSEGDYNTLHQDLYGDIFFPFQAVVFLNQPGVDYTGGEFALIEQKPRMQSRAIVLNPSLGDILIFSTHSHPVKSSRGYYRAILKHGVSTVSSGSRKTLGIIFHDAK